MSTISSKISYKVHRYASVDVRHKRRLIHSSSAFTLIELIVVIFIISVATALVIPNLWDSGERALLSEAKRLGHTLRYIYDEAVSKKSSYSLIINLSDDTWGFESEKEVRSYSMDKGIMFRDVIVPSLGEVSAGKITLTFGPVGPEEPIILHIMKNNFDYTITFNHVSGRAKIHKGYRT